jgi:hypothetical protein
MTVKDYENRKIKIQKLKSLYSVPILHTRNTNPYRNAAF